MNWFDIGFVVILIFFVIVGARLGSVWTGACISGGFVGSFLVDYYGYPVANMLGSFHGAPLVAAGGLFLAGVIVCLIPAWLFSKVSSFFFFPLIDTAFGLATGFFTGLIFISFILLLVVPMFPKIEKNPLWQKSHCVKPLQETLEKIFNNHHFKMKAISRDVDQESKKAVVALTHVAEKTVAETKTLVRHTVNKIKK